MSYPLVTTIIPVGPGANPEWLRQAIESTFAQEPFEHQVLVYLDGFAADDPIIDILDTRVQMVRSPENVGVAAALNELIKLVRGDFVARLDADDKSYAGRYLKQYLLLESGYDIVGSGMVIDGQAYAPPCHDTKRAKELVRSVKVPCFHPTLFAKRIVFDTIKYPTDLPWAEDVGFHALALNAGFEYGNVTTPLVNYRLHELQASQAHRAEQARSAKRATSLLHPDFPTPDEYDAWLEAQRA